MAFTYSPYTTDRIIDGISVTAAGRISLPKYFLHLHGVRPGMRAHLYWDQGNRAIAIHFAATKDQAAYPIHFTGQYDASIQAARFFGLNRLEPTHYRGRYDYKRLQAEKVGITDEQGEVFVIELGQPKVDRANASRALPQPVE